MRKSVLIILGVLLLTAACGKTPPSQSGVATVVAQTLQALNIATSVPATHEVPIPAPTQHPISSAPSESVIPDGTNVSIGGISFLLPNGMGSDATSVNTTDVEFPYVNPSLGDMPQHIKITLNNYAVQGTMFQPQIMVFKAPEYAQYSEMTTQIISVLLQFSDGQPLPEGLPEGPAFNAQIHGITFQNGKGIRYLTQFDQSPMPANNQELIYYFHGMTNDGQYYIQAILPVQAPFLAADGNPNTPLPADGVLFRMDDFAGYTAAITQKLNATDTFSFTPYLAHLDSMMESLQVTGL
jgi:hypothetical protein